MPQPRSTILLRPCPVSSRACHSTHPPHRSTPLLTGCGIGTLSPTPNTCQGPVAICMHTNMYMLHQYIPYHIVTLVPFIRCNYENTRRHHMCLAHTLANDARSHGAMRARCISVIRPIARRGARRNLPVRPAHPSDVRRGHLHSCLQSRLVCMRGTVPITPRVRGRASLHSRRSWYVYILYDTLYE